MGNDLRLSLRLLARDKAYAFAVASTLALALGANAALYSVVHHLLLRPLPVPEPERILLMSNRYPNAGAADSSNSGVPDYYDRKRDVTVLEEQALFNTGNVSLDVEGRPLYEHVALRARSWGADRGNVGLVVGATAPAELERIRAVAPELPFLVPGVGAQGGQAEPVLRLGPATAGPASSVPGGGLLVNVSRGIAAAASGSDDPAAALSAAAQHWAATLKC